LLLARQDLSILEPVKRTGAWGSAEVLKLALPMIGLSRGDFVPCVRMAKRIGASSRVAS
jgi:hypothetical protein